MTTTLSDEEFQRLNDQLLELKVQNYNLEATLTKTSNECNTLKSENEQLRRQLPTGVVGVGHHEQSNRADHSGGVGPSSGQSIKQKLNPFMLAKSIANKVEQARINSAHSQQQHNQHNQQQQQVNKEVANNIELELKSPTNQLAHRLESQELDFLKTNETLKNEINLLQLQLEQSEANNKHLRDQVERLETTTADAVSANAVAAAAVVTAAATTSTTGTSIPKDEVDSVTAGPTFNSPSKQLQQSLESFASSIRSRAQKVTGNNEALVQSLMSALDNRDSNKYKVIESITNVITETSIGAHEDEEDLKNTTEDFKQIWHFFDKLHQASLNDAKSLVALLCHSFVDYDSKAKLVREAELTNERERYVADLELMKEKFLKVAELKFAKAARVTADQFVDYKMATRDIIHEAKKKIVQDIGANAKTNLDMVAKLHNCYEQHISQLKEQNGNASGKLADAQQQIDTLQAKINESLNEHKISEKRGFKIIKELKKQLNSEKNRADKLQAILNSEAADFMDTNKSSVHSSPSNYGINSQHEQAMMITSDKCSSSGSWSCLNEGSGATSPNAKAHHHRATSVHSEFSDIEIVACQKVVSVMSMEQEMCVASTSTAANYAPNLASKQPKPKTLSSSRVASTSSIGSLTLEQENAQLVARVSNLQQEKWRLEEQVNQLEFETGRLALELADKNKLIQHYCIEGRSMTDSSVPSTPTSPQSHNIRATRASTTSTTSTSSSSSFSAKSPTSINNSVLRVVNYLKEKSESVGSADSAKQMAEVNRKLQRMVEEILTKNMHLQANLEQMSDQLMDLRARLRKYENIE